MMGVSYLLFAYATVTGFGYNVDQAGRRRPRSRSSPSPGTAPRRARVLRLPGGLTSTLGVLIAATNSQARLIFNAGREGLLPRWIGRVHAHRRTPMNAIFAFVAHRRRDHRRSGGWAT